jgi:hypothetical protein
MNLESILSKAQGMAGGLSSLFGGGEDDPKKKKSKPYDFDAELKGAYKNKLKYDNNRTAKEVTLSAAQRGKINPAFLLSSAWQEGMNKAVLDPDGVSEAYENAKAKGVDLKGFPVDGFYNYGVDTFGNNYSNLKKYLPDDFAEGTNFRYYDAKNEKGEAIRTAAFRNNEDALVAKSAFMNMEMDNLSSYAKNKGVELDDKAKQYFTMAAFNGGPGRARQMINEYSKAKDKNAYIDKGLTSLGQIHKNISPRMARMKLSEQLLAEEPALPLANPKQILTK